MDDEFLDAVEASKYLKISKARLYAIKQEGKIPYHQVGGRLVFSKKELYEWVMSDQSNNC